MVWFCEFSPWGGLCEAWWESDNATGSCPHEGGIAKKEKKKNTGSETPPT